MSDLISRQVAIDELDKGAWGVEWDKTLAKTMIESLSSAQSEIIRCKDCKWYGRVDKRRFYRGMDCLQKHIDTIVPDRDFCSKAERRGEQDDESRSKSNAQTDTRARGMGTTDKSSGI